MQKTKVFTRGPTVSHRLHLKRNRHHSKSSFSGWNSPTNLKVGGGNGVFEKKCLERGKKKGGGGGYRWFSKTGGETGKARKKEKN